MSKKRVYDVSKELDIPQKELLTLIKDLGGRVRGPMSIVDEAMMGKIQAHLSAQKEDAEEKDRQQQLEKEKRQTEKALRLKKEKEKKEREEKARKEKEKKQKKATAGDDESDSGKKTDRRRRKNKRAEEPEKPDATAAKKKKPRGTETKTDTSRPRRDKKRKRKSKEKTEELDAKAVQQTIRQTIAASEAGRSKQRSRRKQKDVEVQEEEIRNVIRISEFTSVGELANMIGVDPADVIAQCMGLGLMVTINQRLDSDTITMIADEFDYEVELVDPFAEEVDEEEDEIVGELKDRAPVITIMGHVDHGKTSLLDFIRQSNVMGGESGGITQHIGAYSINYQGQQITFLDTPGHEAFTSMRARGAQVTDIVILIVAASEHVMPQTIEAIDHAKAAKVPMIVAVNKIDLANADPQRIRQELTQHNLIVEEYGGEVVAVDISAKHGTGVDKLLEMVQIQAEMLELKAPYEGNVRGVVIESRLDKGRGPVATVLINRGTLEVGQNFVAGDYHGRVRAMFSDQGENVDKALPAMPVEILGFSGVPQAGDSFKVVDDERTARQISSKRQLLKRERDVARRPRVNLENLFDQIQSGLAELNLIIKADTMGSVEALSDSLLRLSNEEVQVKILHQSIGAITENDVNLAAASDAIIVGFHVAANSTVRDLARQEDVEIRQYRVIFEAVDNLKKALEGLLEPEVREVVIGLAEIRQLFSVPKVGQVAGSFVKEGVVRRNAMVRVIRDGVILQEDTLSSLKRFKDDAREVQSGFECGISLQHFTDLKVGDQLEFYIQEEVARTLD